LQTPYPVRQYMLAFDRVFSKSALFCLALLDKARRMAEKHDNP
jgi:hypothetical protein